MAGASRPTKLELTTERIARATCPAGRQQLLLWDAKVHGLAVRIRAGGSKSYVVTYRPGSGGRNAPKRWLTLGNVDAMSLDAARKAARIEAGNVAAGRDPAAEQAEGRRRQRAGVKASLDTYEQDLMRRGIVKAKEIMSLLRRELQAPLGNVDLGTLDRQKLVGRIASIEAQGQRGKAKDFRTKLAVFLNWAANEGLITASPLGGYRKRRQTRAERLSRPGRALENAELPPLWHAIESSHDPFLEAYLKTLVLTGQRRTETALARWADMNLADGVWTIPAEVTKSGREHRVPLPPELVGSLVGLRRMKGTDLVFPGRNLKPMSGWTQRLAPIATAAGLVHWTLHDLRRTARTGLGRLGVDPQIAELLLNHAVGDELQAVYDRGDYWAKRVEAASRWARHVLGLMEDQRPNVVNMQHRLG